MIIETIKVKSDDTGLGYMILNASDFDPTIHEKYKEPKQKEGKPKDGESQGGE